MANSYLTVEPCTLDEILGAALADGFTVTDAVNANGQTTQCGLIHDDGRGCHGMIEEQGANGWTYVGSMNDPKVPGFRMRPE